MMQPWTVVGKMSTLISAIKTPGIFISMSIRAFVNFLLAFTLFVVKARLDLSERISLSLVYCCSIVCTALSDGVFAIVATLIL